MVRRRECGLAVLGLSIVMASALTVRAEAADVPDTAYSRSLQIEPALLDHPSLVFAYPQTAVLYPPQAMALGMTSYGEEEGLGAIFGWNRLRFISLVQYLTPNAPGKTSRLDRGFQLGIALGGEALRLGVAGRASVRSQSTRFPCRTSQRVWESQRMI